MKRAGRGVSGTLPGLLDSDLLSYMPTDFPFDIFVSMV